jgi:hypothetical protein
MKYHHNSQNINFNKNLRHIMDKWRLSSIKYINSNNQMMIVNLKIAQMNKKTSRYSYKSRRCIDRMSAQGVFISNRRKVLL